MACRWGGESCRGAIPPSPILSLQLQRRRRRASRGGDYGVAALAGGPFFLPPLFDAWRECVSFFSHSRSTALVGLTVIFEPPSTSSAVTVVSLRTTSQRPRPPPPWPSPLCTTAVGSAFAESTMCLARLRMSSVFAASAAVTTISTPSLLSLMSVLAPGTAVGQ